jgi:hypothetical protein
MQGLHCCSAPLYMKISSIRPISMMVTCWLRGEQEDRRLRCWVTRQDSCTQVSHTLKGAITGVNRITFASSRHHTKYIPSSSTTTTEPMTSPQAQTAFNSGPKNQTTYKSTIALAYIQAVSTQIRGTGHLRKFPPGTRRVFFLFHGYYTSCRVRLASTLTG